MKYSFYISLLWCVCSFTGLCDGLIIAGYWIKDFNDHWHNATADIYSTTAARLTNCAYLCLVNTKCLLFGYNSATGDCRGFRFLDYNPISIPEQSEVIYKQYQSCVRAGYILLEDEPLCVKRYSMSLTWNDAQAQCENDHGRLAIIDNSQKLDALVKYIVPLNTEQDTAGWVGLNDIDNEGTWVWVNGANLERTYWSRIFLNNYEGGSTIDKFNADCGWIRSRILHDNNCLSQMPFVCEIPYLI